MQFDRHYEGLTEHYKAITLPQPLADDVANGRVGKFTLKSSSKYRGVLLIVSSPGSPDGRGGMIVGRASLDDVAKVDGGWEYRLSNPERIIEFPCQKCGAKGVVWDCFYSAGDVMAYPKINLSRWLKI